jgi:lipoprotein-anchoring transpeptidase ErfK/SrfK
MSVSLSFLHGEQPAEATRGGSGIETAIARLLDGPSGAEQRKGLRTQLPEGVTLKHVEVEKGVATIDLGTAFAAGKADGLPPRLAQVVLTATAVPGVKSARVRVNGKVRQTLHPGIDLEKPVTAAMLGKPKGGPPAPKTPKKKPAAKPSLLETERRLVKLAFMEKADADGRKDAATFNATMAFQKWARIDRDGTIGPQTLAALAKAKRPTPHTKGPAGKRIEVLLDRQVALVIWDGTVTRVLHVSSGRPGYDTPAGSFHVERRYTKDWSVPYAVWLPWASYFVGGVAFHEAPEVPSTAASHGCVRVPHGDAEWLYRRIPVGTPVTVLKSSR